MPITHQKEHFLSPDQKKIKQLIMERLMDSFSHVIQENSHIEFSTQEFTDLIVSCLIMFMRENLIRILVGGNLPSEHRNKFMTDFFDIVRKEVHHRIKKEMH